MGIGTALLAVTGRQQDAIDAFENEIEAVTFRLNDIYHREFVPAVARREVAGAR